MSFGNNWLSGGPILTVKLNDWKSLTIAGISCWTLVVATEQSQIKFSSIMEKESRPEATVSVE